MTVPGEDSPSRRARGADEGAHGARILALALGACGFVVAYAITRAIQARFYPSPDPRTVTHVVRIPFHWRLLSSSWIALLVAVGALGLLRRAPERAERLLPALLVASIVIIVVQGIFVP